MEGKKTPNPCTDKRVVLHPRVCRLTKSCDRRLLLNKSGFLSEGIHTQTQRASKPLNLISLCGCGLLFFLFILGNSCFTAFAAGVASRGNRAGFSGHRPQPHFEQRLVRAAQLGMGQQVRGPVGENQQHHVPVPFHRQRELHRNAAELPAVVRGL